MSWLIGEMDNTVIITKKCEKDLQKAAYKIGALYDPSDMIVEDGKIWFDPDSAEHMDFIDNDEILAVLEKHKVDGRITFGSLDGDNAGKFWGYDFNDGKMTRLEGMVVFKEVKE